MKDVFGSELAVGDIVAFAQPGYHDLHLGVIVRFTPKMVVIVYGRNAEHKIPPSKIVKRHESLPMTSDVTRAFGYYTGMGL